MKLLDKDGKESREVRLTAWTFLLVIVLFILVHVIVAFPRIAHAWDGADLSTDTDISIDVGTRETITDTIIIEPGYDVPVTDSNGDISDVEIISTIETPAGITQIETYNYDAGEYADIEMSNK